MIKLIAFDLDGTLLDDEKNVSGRAVAALEKAAEMGVVIVPSTGRLLKAIPKNVMSLPGLRYAIMINGGTVRDLETGKDIYHCAFSRDEALTVWDAIHDYDAMMDAYIRGDGYMDRDLYDRVPQYCVLPAVVPLVYGTREFVPSVRDVIADRPDHDVEKFNVYFNRDTYTELKPAARVRLGELDFLKVSTSVINNFELNRQGADKGFGLRSLCEYLDIDISETLAIGDGENDIEMLDTAGLGVAMLNAEDNIKSHANAVSEYDCNHEGFARTIEKYVLGM